MKIAFIGQKGMPAYAGGVERRVQELSIRMAQLGHEVFVYARKENGSEMPTSYQGVHIIYLPYIRRKNLEAITHTFLASLHALFQRYDIVHFQAPGPSSLCWIVKFFNPATGLIATFNSRDDKHQKWGLFARLYLKFGEFVINKVPDLTIVVSRLLCEYAKQKFHNNPVVIHNGSAATLIGTGDEIKQWNLEKNKYFLTVSRLVRHKGIHYLIQAFEQGRKQGRLPEDFKLVIVGSGAYTDDYVAYLKEMAKDNPQIVFTGDQADANLSQLFAQAFAFVQPSEAEGLSNALLEAMGYGLLTIVSDIPENTMVVGHNGLTFRNKSVSGLSHQLSHAIQNPTLAQDLGQKGKACVEKDYDWDENVARTISLYEQVLAKKSGSSSLCADKRLA